MSGKPKRLAAAGLLVACGMSVADCNHDCGPSCESGVGITAHLVVAPTALDGATVTLCWNGTCANGMPTSIDGSGTSDFLMTGTLMASCEIRPEQDGSTVEVHFGRDDLANGDVYELTVVSGSGASLFQKTASETYRTFEDSCGDVCEILAADLHP